MGPRLKNFLNKKQKGSGNKFPCFTTSHELVEIVGLLVVGLISLLITLKIPLSGTLSNFFRHGYSFWLIAILLSLFLTYHLPVLIRKPINFSLIVVLCTLPLTALWLEAYAEMQIFGGLLSFSDSAQYFHEANRLLAGFPMTSFGARHPNAPALLTSLLAITGNNLQQTLAIFVFLNALGVFLSAYVIRNIYGPLTASIVVLLAFLFFRRFIGMTDTENLGFLMGCLAMAVLLLGAKNRKKHFIFWGMMFSSFALNTRPGTFFILPTLLIWALTTPKIRNLYKANLDKNKLVAALILPFLLNVLLANAISMGGKGIFSNFSFTLYGITDGGRGWEQIFKDHPEINQMSSSQSSNFAYQLAYQNFKDDPTNTLRGFGGSYRDFFSTRDSSVFGFVSGGDLTAFNHPDSQNQRAYQTIRILLMFFSLGGLSWLWCKRSMPENRLLLWGMLGVFLSIPFLPPGDAGIMRVYATSIPFIILLPGLGLKWLNLRSDLGNEPIKQGNLLGNVTKILGISLIVVVIFGSFAVYHLNKNQNNFEIGCTPQKATAVIKVRNGSYLYLLDDESLETTYLPWVKLSDFQFRLQNFPYADKIQELQTLRPSKLLMNAVDLRDGKLLWVVIDPESLDVVDVPIAMCGYWMPVLLSQGFGFLYVEEYQVID
jgi:hypothetical protein